MFQRVHPGQGIGYEATCAAAGTVCRNPPTALKLNGQRITSQYCQFHACRQVEGGRACPNAKLPRAVVCSQHIRCQAVDNGTRCNLDVKDGNSALYRYCTPLHLCTLPGCEAQRTWHNGQDLAFCHEHRCEHDDCRNHKDAGPFCKDHTCDDTHCIAFAQGVDPDDPQRFCERHRHCQKPQCRRLCHVRDNGQPSPFCGAHYCEAPDCEAEREGGFHCRDHTCAEQGCIEGQESPGGGYCKKHACKTRNCRLRRLGKDYCPYHECVYGGCEAEAMEGRYCEGHQQCSEAGCENRRFSFQGTTHIVCEDHLYGVCPGNNDRRGCGRRAERGTRFCEHHLCQVRDCQDSKAPPFEFCISHKCLVPECHRPRQTSIHGLAQGNADGLFCDGHGCRQVGCNNQAAVGSGWCLNHGRNRMVGVRQQMGQAEDELGEPVPGHGEAGYRRPQRHLGWAERRYQDPWASWGMAM